MEIFFRELASTQTLRSRWTPGEVRVLTCRVSEILAETNCRRSTASIAKVLETRGQDGGRTQASLAKAIAKVRDRALLDLQSQVTQGGVAQILEGNSGSRGAVCSGNPVGTNTQVEAGDDSMSGAGLDESLVTVESLGPDLESDSISITASLGPGQEAVEILGRTGNEFNLSQESMDKSVNLPPPPLKGCQK